MLLGAFLDQVLDVLAQEHPQAIAVDLKQLVLSERTKLVESRTEAERPDVRAGQQKRLREYITVVGTCIDRLREVAGPEICGQRASIIFRTVRHG
jgi:hypothetical protein